MNYILAIVSLILVQNTASDDPQNRRNVNDSFNVNIGAGYAVGLDQSSPPNGTSNISLSKNYYSSSLNAEAKPPASVRGPRILSNFTPQIGNPIPEVPKNHAESQSLFPNSGYKDHYSTSSSNIHSYNTPILPTSSDLDEPNLVDFQKILSEVETKKPFSKILQVIKVPAIYEIHFQSDDNQKKVNLDPTANLFWKNYYDNIPNTITHNFDDYSKWVNHAHLQEEDGKWLNNAHLQEEHLSKDGKKYYDFSDTPVVSYENVHGSHSPHGKPEGNGGLQPPTTHHYSDTKFSNFDSDKDVRINHISDSFTKPTWINKDYLRNKKHPHTINNFKRHVVYNTHGSNPTGQSLQNEMDTYGPNTKNLAPFKHNQVITENDKPQALHEVPAPFLGKYQQPRPFEIQKLSDSHSKLLPTTTSYKQTKVKFNKLSPTTPKPTFNYKNINGYLNSKSSNSFRKKNIAAKLEPFYKDNDNLIYGKKSEQILTPYEINIPVIPGSTMVTVTDNPYNRGKTSHQNFHYSTSMTTNTYSKKPENINTFNDHYKQVANLRQQSSKRVDQNSEYAVNNKNTFNSVDVSEKNTNENNFQYPDASTNSINTISSEKPEILDNKLNKYYKEVIDIPHQTQKSISIENVISTTPNSGIALGQGTAVATNTISSYEVPNNSQLDQQIKKNTDKNMEGVTSKQREILRRRVFNTSYNRYMNNGYLKNSQQSRISKRKSISPRLDSIIYITRKSTA